MRVIFDENMWFFGDDELVKYVPVVNANGVPRYYKVNHNTRGSFVTIDGKREYFLVRSD